MNETKVYYRVLNEEEIIGEFWNSIEDLTSRQQMTQEYYPQIEAYKRNLQIEAIKWMIN